MVVIDESSGSAELTNNLDVGSPLSFTILAKDPLPNVKNAFYIMSKEESHRDLHPGVSGNNKSQPAPFVVKTNNNINNFNRRVNTNNNNNNRGPNYNMLCNNGGLIGHTVDRFNANTKINQSVPSSSVSISASFTNE
ncbi:hypothetical protein Tco_0038919 [Tanacetum coccineum]